MTIAVEPDPAERLAERLTVQHALDALSAEHRDVLRQVYLNGHTANETADVLGIPAGTVKSRVHYGLRALRELCRQRQVLAACA
jgi:RNA polymerase sigma-70 factor (ECF subfamily)